MCPYYRGVLIERYHTIEYKGTYCRVILYQVIVSIIEYYSYTVDVHIMQQLFIPTVCTVLYMTFNIHCIAYTN